MNPLFLAGVAFVGVVLGGLLGFALKSTEIEEPAIFIANQSIDMAEVSILPDFSYPDLQGKERQSGEWHAKILVLNFWATWCPPCREETPLFVDLQAQYRHDNVKFVSIAIDDLEPVKAFVEEYQINYPVLMGDMGAVALSRKLGNRFEGLPFTVVVAPGGSVILRHTGGISRQQLEPVLQEAIDKGRRTHEPTKRI
jgi:thiol-disulfide isomerase/thioredoxin